MKDTLQKKVKWGKTNDYYNKEVVKCDVYSKKFRRGMLYIQDTENFMYSCSFGANSDYSYSGSFYNITKITNVNEAMNALDIIVPLQLADKEAIEYLNNLR